MGEVIYRQFFIVRRRPGHNAVLDQAETLEQAERLRKRFYRRHPDNFILEVVARDQERRRVGWAGRPL